MRLAHHVRLACLALASALTVGASGVLAGCGFHVRNTQTMAFESAQLTGFAGNSRLAHELARALQASGVNVVDSTLSATLAAASPRVPVTHIVIDGISDKHDTVVSTTTAYGQVRDVTVRNTLRFQVKRGDGSLLLPPTDVALGRDMTYNESSALAKQDETDALVLAMQTDIVGQVMRRLAAIRADQLPAPAPPPPASAPVTLREWEAARQAAAASAAASAAAAASSASTPAASR